LVRVGGFESDIRLLNPREFHTDTSELFQMLKKGHHGVELDTESWERLATWVDFNAPCHGTWRETVGWETIAELHRRRRALEALYATVGDDPETIPETTRVNIQPIRPKPAPKTAAPVPDCPGWPLEAAEARRRQAAAGPRTQRTVDLGGNAKLELVLIPAGEFVMGDTEGCGDERPLSRVKIEEPFWIGRFEVTNRQYARFDPTHDSRHEHGTASFIGERAIGPPLNRPEQPVVRVSWSEARAFCRWLSKKSGLAFGLATEAQWEYACRAGTAGPLSYGDLDADFSKFANVADATINKWAYFNETRRSADQVPRDARFNDQALVTVDVGRYRPNAWGLHDLHGNVWEWTRSVYKPYPYSAHDGRNETTEAGRRVVRGGSWYDRPTRCRSAFRLSYPPWQKVYNVGFRVVREVKPAQQFAQVAPDK
jgi:formylglycine-generating enzyme required for sulfatase activity